MEVVSFSPLRTAQVVWQPRPGAWMLTAICKATYVLRPMETLLAPDQDEPTAEDEYWDDDEGRSLRAASDMAPFKARADVVLVGHAYAPQRQPVSALHVRMIVGELDKSMAVSCDRAWTPDGQLREGARFTRMPLVYERAAGGPETMNPVGVRDGGRAERNGLIALPNLAPAGMRAPVPGERIEPVGFGPMAPTWPSRMWRIPRNATDFSHRAWREAPLPEGMDGSYWNVAPPDQQLPYLRTNERIHLENLHPEHAQLSTSLPGGVSYPTATVERNGNVDELPLRCDTLVIDTDSGRCTLTWRGQVALEHPSQPGRVCVSLVGAVQPRRAPPPSPAKKGLSATVDAAAIAQAKAAMPFQQSVPPPRPVPVSAPVAVSAPVPVSAPEPAIPRSPWAVGDAPVPQPSGLSVGQLVAQSAEPAPVRREEPVSTPVPSAAPSSTSLATRGLTREALQLLWFEPRSISRIRRVPRWRETLDALPQTASDTELDEPAFEDDPSEIEDRREIGDLLSCGKLADEGGLTALSTNAVRENGMFAPPLELTAGELVLPFDELSTLKATVAAAAPLTAADERLKAVVDGAREFLKTMEPFTPTSIIDSHTQRIREAFGQRRGATGGYLEPLADRALVEQRAYQRRTVLGKPHLRALLHVAGSPQPIPTYLPEELSSKLPMFVRFRVRLIAEVHFQVDQYESHPVALRAVALARAMAPDHRR